MSLKNRILDYIKSEGPKSDREIAIHFGQKQPSVRRSRNELVKENKLERGEKDDEVRWRIPSGEAKTEAAPRFKPEPEAVPAEQKDWRATSFTF